MGLKNHLMKFFVKLISSIQYGIRKSYSTEDDGMHLVFLGKKFPCQINSITETKGKKFTIF